MDKPKNKEELFEMMKTEFKLTGHRISYAMFRSLRSYLDIHAISYNQEELDIFILQCLCVETQDENAPLEKLETTK